MSASCVALYAVFLFVQTIRHRDYFLADASEHHPVHDTPSDKTTAISVALLVVA